jgi:transposase
MIARLFIGIDVSQDWFDVLVLRGKSPAPLRFSNDEGGRNAFLEHVKGLQARHVHVGLEHTGGLETALALLAHENGLAVSLLDGATLAKYRESFGRARAKTDAEDARLIARYLKERKPARWNPEPEEYRLLTELVRHRTDLLETRKAWNSRAGRASLGEFVAAQRKCLLDVLNLQIQELERELRAYVARHAELAEAVKLLEGVPGIRFVSAVRILAEMGPAKNYASPRALALAAGLCPIGVGSGKSPVRGVLHVYGNRELRNALYMPAMVAIREDTPLALFARRIAGNAPKAKKTVLVATMRKLAQVVLGILKSGKPYDPELLLKHMKTKA